MYNHVVKYDDHVVGEVGRVQVHVQRGDHRGEGQGGERGHAVSSSVFYVATQCLRFLNLILSFLTTFTSVSEQLDYRTKGLDVIYDNE